MYRMHNNPSHQAQEIANLNKALSFITGADGLNPDPIRLENIGVVDINDENLVIIMGLVWSLILQYQISLYGSKPKGKCICWFLRFSNIFAHHFCCFKLTEAPQALMRWVQHRLAGFDLNINNFTTE